MDFSSILYQDACPYPPAAADAPNPQYAAAILSNVGAHDSEISAVSLYFYNSLIIRPKFQDIAECFHQISLVEMRHLDLFGELALNLGADPRLWSSSRNRMQYWSPSYNRYPTQLAAIIQNSLASEQAAVRKYRAQADWIEDPQVKALLERIILDEELHIHIFQELLEELIPPAAPDPDMPGSCIPSE